MKKFIHKTKDVLVLWIASLIAFCVVLWVGEVANDLGLGLIEVSILRGILLSVTFGTLIWIAVRSQKSKREILGLQGAAQNMKYFSLGMGLLLGPLLVTLLLSSQFGWAAYDLNPSIDIIMRQLIAILVVLLFEAFPEEIVFRGYILGKLKTEYSKLVSGLITVILFVLLPVIVVPVQMHLIGMDVQVGGNSGITGGYLIYMMLFGGLTVALRNITGNVWTSIGFHLVFVSMNYLIGISERSLLVITDYQRELPIQITLLGCILIILFVLVRFRRKNMGRLTTVSN